MTFTAPATLTDLYQLTMLQGYFTERMEETAVFEFFVRRLPPQRNFLVAAGLKQVLEFVQQFQFTTMELDWLRSTGRFSSEFLSHLEKLRFTGDVEDHRVGAQFSFGRCARDRHGAPGRVKSWSTGEGALQF